MEFRDLKTQYKKNKRAINKSIKRVLNEGVFIGGKPVEELESKLAEYVGTKYCISCANGTDALTLVLMAWGIGQGDAVFVPDFTFFATAEAPAFLGATPIFVDVDENTFNMCPDSLEKAIKAVIKEKKLIAKVIIPVDLFGLPADYDRIIPIAKKYNLLILEDAAQGFGGSIRDKKACSFGDAAITSFFPAKSLGCYGDGGAIFTDNNDLRLIIESLKVHGKGINKYENIQVGMNSRLDTLQAAILQRKFMIFTRKEIKSLEIIFLKYNKLLEGIVDVPKIPQNYSSGYAQYTIKLTSKTKRKMLQEYLKNFNIPSMIYYEKSLSNQKAFSHLKNNSLEFKSIRLSDTVISLPFHPYMKEADIVLVCRKIKEFCEGYNL